MTEKVVTRKHRERHPLPGFEHNIVWGKKRNRTSGEEIWKQRCSLKNTSTILEQIAMAFAGAGTSAQDMLPKIQRYAAAYQDAKRFSMDQMAQRSNMPPSMGPSTSQSMGYPGNMFADGMPGGSKAPIFRGADIQGFMPYPGANNGQSYDQMNHFMGQSTASHHPTGQNSHMPWHMMGERDARVKLEESDKYSNAKRRKSMRKKSCQYTGVRRRQWGTFAAEIRNPKSGAREWLGTFETAEEAAVVYDARLRQIKGPSAPRANFPELNQSGPMLDREICPHGQSSSQREIIQIPCNWMDQILEYKKKVQILQNS